MKTICNLINNDNIRTKVIFAHVISWLMILSLSYFILHNSIYPESHSMTLIWIELTALVISLYIKYLIEKDINLAATLLSFNITVTISLAILAAPFTNTTIAWIFVVPATSVFLQGFQKSRVSNIVFFIFILFYLFVLNIDAIKFVSKINLLLSYIVVISTIYTYELNRTCVNRKNRVLMEELAVKNNSLEILSSTDALTSLYNRTKIDEIINSEIKRTKRYSAPLSAMLIDIDYFKYVNDTYGHQAGDMILKEFSNLLSSSFRESDYISRWGGEEFLIILPNTTLENSIILAKKFTTLMENTKFSYAFSNTCSIGVSHLTQEDTKESLIERADKALYMAKERGRNMVVSESDLLT